MRQEEERLRREDDETFKQYVKAEQTTIDTYLADLVTSSVFAQAGREVRTLISALLTSSFSAQAGREVRSLIRTLLT